MPQSKKGGREGGREGGGWDEKGHALSLERLL